MDSPILLLAFWFVVNLVIKSVKDKKNIEEARRKRNQQMDNRPIQSKNLSNSTRKDESRTNSNKNKSIIDVFKEEIQNEIKKEKEKQIQKQPQNTTQMKDLINDNTSYTVKSSEKEIKKEEIVTNQFNEPKHKNPRPFKQVNQTQINKPKLDLKNDVLKGIIFSEILSEPKGVKNLKRGI